MLKAMGRDADGKPILLFGLSGENVTRIVAGEPINFDLSEMGMDPCQVVIMYGKTEWDIEAELRRQLGARMRTHVTPLAATDR